MGQTERRRGHGSAAQIKFHRLFASFSFRRLNLVVAWNDGKERRCGINDNFDLQIRSLVFEPASSPATAASAAAGGGAAGKAVAAGEAAVSRIVVIGKAEDEADGGAEDCVKVDDVAMDEVGEAAATDTVE